MSPDPELPGPEFPPRESLGPPPPRRPGSLRRTSSLLSAFPAGNEGPLVMQGRARDLYTDRDPSKPRVIAEDDLEVRFAAGRRVETITASRCSEILGGLRGLRAGKEMREYVASALPAEQAHASLLFHLLDGIGGASRVAAGAWSTMPSGLEALKANPNAAAVDRVTRDVCFGFRTGSRALTMDGRSRVDTISRGRSPLPLREDDPLAWHDMHASPPPNQLRIRCLDLWTQDDGTIKISAFFQDSIAVPDTTARAIMHEYRIEASIDPVDSRLEAMDVTASVLPFTDCIGAAQGARQLIGKSIARFRQTVPAMLAGPAGCTHLNEMMRNLQDVPSLLTTLKHSL